MYISIIYIYRDDIYMCVYVCDIYITYIYITYIYTYTFCFGCLRFRDYYDYKALVGSRTLRVSVTSVQALTGGLGMKV